MSKELPDVTSQAWARLVRAQQTALGGVEADLKQAGFPPLVWYDILLELERALDGRLRHRDIERGMLLQRYHVTRVVERMERDGLVSRAPCPDDARGAYAAITDRGRAMRREMWPVYAAAIDKHFAEHFTQKELAQLGAFLGRLS